MTKLSQEFRNAPGLESTDPLLSDYVQDARKAAQTLAGLPGWEASDDVLAKGITATLPGNGFAPAVATCTPTRWTQLRLALARK